jgi:peptidoglycan/LPS O-acetylase OafA/YrhL
VRAVLRLQELMRPYAVTSPTHLSGLDSLRWYSALAVIITHVELHKRYHGLANVWDSVWIQNLGPAGVYFFFALSGFLITWLLKKERANALSTVLPSFYRRRAWRILPLYYLLVVLGFLVLPQFSAFAYPEGMSAGPNASELVAFVSAQPHVASSFLQRVPNISHLWSIGVELTFYSFWPLMVLRSRNLNRSIVVFIAGILTVKASLLLLGPALFHDPQPFFHFAATLKFECMAVGAWFALRKGQRMESLLSHPRTVWFALAAIPPVFLLYGTRLDNVVHLPLSVLFGIIVSGVAFSPGPPARFLDNRVSNYLGRISYGIYCYHVACISLVLNVFPVRTLGTIWGNLILYLCVLLLTTTVSAISFEFFELPISRRARKVISVSPQVTQSISSTSHKSSAA